MGTLLLFIVILGVLILVHELGHFLSARRSGMKVEEFGFGFPPRALGIVRDEKTGKHRIVPGNREVSSKYTVYSINWIPFGGFVRIKGENGDTDDADSFASKGHFTRIKVLAAGVIMNFVLAWVLIAGVLMAGFPQAVDPEAKVDPTTLSVQIAQVAEGSPAEEMGLQMGDIVVSANGEPYLRVADVQRIIEVHRGLPLEFEIRRGEEILTVTGTPRVDAPQGQGALGIALGEVTITKYSFFQAIVEGAVGTWHQTLLTLQGFGMLFSGLFSGDHEILKSVSGPIGIAYLTGEVSDLGWTYLLFFTALLSINLGILNILPFPALDGGRILFVLIEWIKGSPVSERVEGWFHQTGFLLLIVLMIVITAHDFLRFEVFGKFFD